MVSPGRPRHALDVVGLRLGRELEHRHVEPLGIFVLVEELADQDAVAVERRFPLETMVGVAAHRAGSARHVLAGDQRAGHLVDLFAGADLVVVAALGADHVLVAPHQRGGHRTGRDHKRLGLERSEQEGQHKGDHDRLDQFAKRGLGGHVAFGRGRSPRGNWGVRLRLDRSTPVPFHDLLRSFRHSRYPLRWENRSPRGGQSHFRGEDAGSPGNALCAAKIGTVPCQRLSAYSMIPPLS